MEGRFILIGVQKASCGMGGTQRRLTHLTYSTAHDMLLPLFWLSRGQHDVSMQRSQDSGSNYNDKITKMLSSHYCRWLVRERRTRD